MTTRAEIITRARQKAHLENSPFVDTAAPLFFQEAYNEVYSLFSSKGMHMLEADITITATGATDYAVTPAAGQNPMVVLNVFRVDGTNYYPLRRVQPDMEAAVRSLSTGEANYYKITRPNSIASNVRRIKLYPNPSSGSYIIHYVPECPVTTADADVILSVGPSDALMACILAKKFCVRESEYNPGLDKEQEQLFYEVNRIAEQAEIAPSVVQDTRGRAIRDESAFNYWPEYLW